MSTKVSKKKTTSKEEMATKKRRFAEMIIQTYPVLIEKHQDQIQEEKRRIAKYKEKQLKVDLAQLNVTSQGVTDEYELTRLKSELFTVKKAIKDYKEKIDASHVQICSLNETIVSQEQTIAKEQGFLDQLEPMEVQAK